jgi:mRNA-degrading endonuclease HigB of HigAB toxin-antitoxin module
MHSRLQNSTFLINLSLETRKEMAQGVRERLLELMEAKQWERPLEVRYDEQINYLKNAEGNYLFDLRGNMFKVAVAELAKLEEERIVVRMRKREMSGSKVKLTHC